MSLSIVNASDAEHGYTFGVDGVVAMPQAMRMLSLSRDTVMRRIDEGRLRAGRDGRLLRICLRSIHRYLADLEV